MVKPSVTPPARGFVLLPDPPLAYAPALLDPRIQVVTIARALARAGLRMTYSVDRKALVIEICQ